MTELLNVEFADETGATAQAHPRRTADLHQRGRRRGQRDHHPADRLGRQGARRTSRSARQLVEDPTLIPQAIEELLRFEPPAPHVARYVTRDVEYYGQTVPAGSAMMMLDRLPPTATTASSARRRRRSTSTANCASTWLQRRRALLPRHALARLEGRIALEEILKRFPRVGGRPDNCVSPDLDGARLGDRCRLVVTR